MEGTGVLWCDGRRRYELTPGARIEAVRSELPVRLARIEQNQIRPAQLLYLIPEVPDTLILKERKS